jgi:hypothetical protein
VRQRARCTGCEAWVEAHTFGARPRKETVDTIAWLTLWVQVCIFSLLYLHSATPFCYNKTSQLHNVLPIVNGKLVCWVESGASNSQFLSAGTCQALPQMLWQQWKLIARSFYRALCCAVQHPHQLLCVLRNALLDSDLGDCPSCAARLVGFSHCMMPVTDNLSQRLPGVAGDGVDGQVNAGEQLEPDRLAGLLCLQPCPHLLGRQAQPFNGCVCVQMCQQKVVPEGRCRS